MKIKIIFSFLSVAFFSAGVLLLSGDGRSGEVLGDSVNVSIGTQQPGISLTDMTAQVSADLMSPSLHGFLSGATSVKLTWTRPGNASGTVTYKILRDGNVIKILSEYLTYENAGLNPGSEYKYVVAATDSSGRVSYSSDIRIVVPALSVSTNPVGAATVADPASATVAVSPSASASTTTAITPTSTPTSASATVPDSSSNTSSGSSVATSAPEMKISYPVYDRPGGNAPTPSGSVGTVGTPSQEQDVRVPGAPVVTLSDRDTDSDGLPDAEEVRIGTDPRSGDTDGDGFPDTEEIRKGFNPLKSAASDRGDKIVFESPKEKRISNSAVEDRHLRVEKIERVARADGAAATRITGKGTPNSFLTLYIYSDPIVVTVKTDESGNWTYELDRDLEDGNHEVYVAVTDSTGRISSQSSPIPFVKTAQAISVVPVSDTGDALKGNRSPIEQAGGQFVFFGIALVIMFLIAGFYFIGHKAFSD